MEKTIKIKEKNIGQFVAEDYRTAAIFKKYNIDFCCKGHRTLKEVCEKKGIDQNLIVDELEIVLNSNSNQSIDYKSWPLDLLIDYIEKTHHRYVEEKIPILKQFLDKLCRVHGERHPELFKINKLFIASSNELTAHMKKEELILFPFIKKLVRAKLDSQMVLQPAFGTVENPIAMMMNEHDNEGERFRIIAELTNNYQPPVDACNTYRVTFAMLDEFEKDLHLHIHLENNILFPGAVKLEKQFEIQAN
ncbi:iron-sulfur cluster repair di-iron protein [Mangrovimonas sp. AS39]|uniref:iron-sulfur cluster repair di-iron protein n=1 Tax=Mangrovimonas futianensis TaxID=2895523 RepID=UPI001E5E7CA4|nr:iron-sulfur cluster repair di-iron protein [Mangrovimonas futianensis]MCF1192290.1 iron-sulfur cluster repair di-iron protein [Mangrovimonas futianensis]MCF1195961.1 iron-sulfur cluster repair di-iron protein [Mangrovimonas futianensis]MCF1422981.1 iron-sulfur cluster repair di-iron protein [Mangrovimonas futianensis]